MEELNLIRYYSGQTSVDFNHFIVAGTDAESFLQGQTTGDVSGVRQGCFQLQAIVDRTGKIEAHFYLIKTANGIELLTPPSLASAVQRRFEMFVISEEVELRNLGIETWWLALGPDSPEGPYSGFLGGELAAFSPDKLDITLVERSVVDRFLMWQGYPSLDQSYHIGEMINQTRLFDTAVQLNKGCFPGQETVAKIHHNRGAAWAPVLLKANPPGSSVPAHIQIEDKKVAKILCDEFRAGEHWCTAEVLRDVRVEGLKLAHGSVEFVVHNYPRFTIDPLEKARLLFYQGTQAFQVEDVESAFSQWKKAIALAPNYSDPYEAMGVLLGRQGKFEEAIGWMNRLLVIEPQSVMAHTNLSMFLMKLGKIKEAEDHKALATVASFSSFGREAQKKEALEAESQKKALELAQREGMFHEVLAIDPDDALANYGLGVIAMEKMEFQRARTYFETVLKSDSQYSVAYLGLGKVLLGLNEPSRAKEVLSQGVKVAAKKGELMPANEMQSLLSQIE